MLFTFILFSLAFTHPSRCRENAEIEVSPGTYSPTGPRCMLSQIDGIRAGRCADGESGERVQPGGFAQVYPCAKHWHQFFSVGNGDTAPRGSLHMTIPRHIVQRIRDSGYEQQPYLCLGVLGRGSGDEEEWEEDLMKLEEYSYEEIEEEEEEQEEEEDEEADGEDEQDEVEQEADSFVALSEWKDVPLVTTRCSNTGGVIEWLFVPYIVEETTPGAEASGSEEQDVKEEL